MSDEERVPRTDHDLTKLLNSKGFPFQYAALKACLNAGRPDYRWRHAGTEYAVELHSDSTHADFVLAFKTHLLVAECKRADDQRWLFARGYSDLKDYDERRVRFDYVMRLDAGGPLYRRVGTVGHWIPFDVHAETKRRHRPSECDTSPKDLHALDGAITQVLRARSGLMDDLGRQPALRYGGGAVVPVIITNAELLATDDELHKADVMTGRLEGIVATSVTHLWLDHNLSAALRPSLPRATTHVVDDPTKTQLIKSRLRHEMTRSIAIVRPDGLGELLTGLAIQLTAGVDMLRD